MMINSCIAVWKAPVESCAGDEAMIKVTCEKELKLYLQTPGMHLQGVDMEYTNPLPWWAKKVEHNKFPILSKLAEAFLAAHATSMTLERIWSQSTQVLTTTKRAMLDSEVASGIMFVKENVEVIKKHCNVMTDKMTDPVPPHLISQLTLRIRMRSMLVILEYWEAFSIEQHTWKR